MNDQEQLDQEIRLELARRTWGLDRPMGPLTERQQAVVDAVDGYQTMREKPSNVSVLKPRSRQ